MKEFIGTVISAKSVKTAIVEIQRFREHPIYKKRLRIKKRYPVHDEVGVKEGQKVKFVEVKPISKRKKWKIVEVINK